MLKSRLLANEPASRKIARVNPLLLLCQILGDPDTQCMVVHTANDLPLSLKSIFPLNLLSLEGVDFSKPHLAGTRL